MNVPLKFAYEWLTDYSEDDPKITGSKSQRTILEKSRRETVYLTSYKGDDDRVFTVVNIVTLKPPSSWHLDQYGIEDNETGDYKLVKLGKSKTRINMVFKETWKNIREIPTIEEQVRHTSEIWDKYVAALEHDYSSKHSS